MYDSKRGRTLTFIKYENNWMNLILLCFGIWLLMTQVTVDELSRMLGAGEAKPTVDSEMKFTVTYVPCLKNHWTAET